MVNDPITDMFIRIKNAQAVNKETVSFPFSKTKQEIANILKKEKLISDFEKKGRGAKKRLELGLSYKSGNLPAITDFKRISKPGQRRYVGRQEIFPVKGGYGLSIISTSRGIMSGKDAKKNKMGGEVLIEVW